jgi:hypothetical protein
MWAAACRIGLAVHEEEISHRKRAAGLEVYGGGRIAQRRLAKLNLGLSGA